MHQLCDWIEPQFDIIHKAEPGGGGFCPHITVGLADEFCARLLQQQTCQPLQSLSARLSAAGCKWLNHCICGLRVPRVQSSLTADAVGRVRRCCQAAFMHPQCLGRAATQEAKLTGCNQQCRSHDDGDDRKESEFEDHGA